MARNFLGLLMLLLLVVGSEAAPITLGPRHRDESNGFQIQIPEKWDQVPIRFQEVALVGKWNGREKRGRIAPALFVLRFVKPKEAPVTPGAAPAPDKAVPPGWEIMRVQEKNVWEYVERFVPEHDITEDDPAFKLSSKDLVAHLRVYREKVRGDPNDRRTQEFQTLIVAAEVRTVEPSDVVYGVAYGCSAADEENMMSAFRASIKRFKVLQPGEEETDGEGGAAADAGNIFVDSEKKPEEWRNARKKKLAGLKEWDALDTENYLIVYNKEVKRPLLNQIAKHIELIRADVYEKIFPPTREVKAVSVVRVCKDAEEYHRYGGPGGSAGYWADHDEELVFYQDRANRTDSLRVLYHEAFHQYIYYAVGNVAPHSWFNEGHGDYFAGHDCVGGKFIAKPFRWRTGIIADALSQKSWVPLEKFLKYTQGEYYANPGLCYAQGWSFIYFLREVEKKKIVKYKKYWGLLDRYFDAIKRNVKTVKDGGLEGLSDPPPPPPDDGTKPPDENDGQLPGGPPVSPPTEEPTVKRRDLPSLPGLEEPFPGEHPEAGAAEGASKSGEGGPASAKGDRRTVAGPRISDEDSALNAAVDEVFLKNKEIDIKELEKDWVEWSK
jgi:hypothetical protein